MSHKNTTINPLSPHEWQCEFVEAIFSGLSDTLSKDFTVKANEQQQRFNIYQNNVFYSLSQALGDLYPCVKTMVGDVFFKGAARAYIHQHPPTQAAMVYFGHDFTDFLASFEHTQNMPYLADMAKLELARHQAYHAADECSLDSHYFSTVDASAFEQARGDFHPSFQLLSSPFPIFTLWQAHQDPKSEADLSQINLSEPEWVVVVRYDYEIIVMTIDYGTYLFYKALSRGHTISEAASDSLNKASSVDISAAIALSIRHKFFIHLIL